jgi:uracil-DNA glycosylase
MVQENDRVLRESSAEFSVVKTVAAKSTRDISRPKRGRSQSAPSSPAFLISPHASLADLRRAASGCKACDLWKTATQTVFGEGRSSAAVVLVGEQPGDQEDRAGGPFVGPAGRILDQALAQAGIDRADVYVTNVVKHFKWSPAERGKRRIHKKPRYSETQACRPWLDAELDAVRPEVLVCLGASAAQALLGKDFRVTRDRGRLILSHLAANVIATVHPSSILRARDDESRQSQLQSFINDLRFVAQVIRDARRRTVRRRDKAH